MPTRPTSRSARQQYGAVMLGVLALCAMPTGASAQTMATASSTASARTLAFDIPAAPLVATLREISRVSGLRIDVDAESVTGKQAPAIKGTLSVDEALALAMADNGVQARRVGAGYWVAVPGKLGTVVVAARRDQAETSFKADRSDTATRSGTDLMELPGAVTIITSKVLESQQALSVRDALANVSGMGFNKTPQGSPTFTVRGYGQTAALVNGLSDTSASLTNVFGVERIEVLKGPQAILSGSGTLGGGVNVVTKKPQADPIRSVMLQYGSHGDLTVAGDVGQALSDDGRLSFRLIAAHSQARDNNFGFDGRKDDSWLPQLRWKDATTDLIVGASYGKQHAPVPAYTFARRDGFILPMPGMLVGRREDGFDTEQKRFFYQLEQTITPSITFISRVQRSLQETEIHMRSPNGLSYARGAANDSPLDTVIFYASRTVMNQRDLSGDHYLRITGDTGPLKHKLSVGINHTDTVLNQPQWSGASTTATLYPTPVPLAFGDLRADASTLSSVSNQHNTQLAGFAQDLMTWGDWNLLVNLRRNRYTVESSAAFPTANVTSTSPKATIWSTTPGVGLVYTLTPQVSLYTNYAEGFVPATNVSCNGGFVPPVTTRNREVGAKFDLFDSKLSLTAAAYELALSNQLAYNQVKRCYDVRDAQVSRGFEIDAQGQAARGLSVLFNYTYAALKDVGNPNTVYTGVPKHKMSLWSTYEVQNEAWRGLGLGLGISATAKSKGNYDARYMAVVPGQAQIDASVFYNRGPWSTTFGIKNIADRLLYATTVSSSFIPVLERRNFMLTVKRDFK